MSSHPLPHCATTALPDQALPSLPQPALCVRDLRVRLGNARDGRDVLHGLSLSLPAGRWTAVVGPNGAGKSTLLAALAGLRPAQGEVIWQGRPLAQWPQRERARHLVWLAQGQGGAEDLSVRDVVMLGRMPHQSWLGGVSAADTHAVQQALQAVGAWDWRERALGALSGGERQRVLLARALATEAQVLLMDEPLANLDPPHQADWVALVRALVAQGRTVVSVLHELNIALLADELLVLQHGTLCHQGACDSADSHRALEAVFDARIAVHASEATQGHPFWVSLTGLPPKPFNAPDRAKERHDD